MHDSAKWILSPQRMQQYGNPSGHWSQTKSLSASEWKQHRGLTPCSCTDGGEWRRWWWRWWWCQQQWQRWRGPPLQTPKLWTERLPGQQTLGHQPGPAREHPQWPWELWYTVRWRARHHLRWVCLPSLPSRSLPLNTQSPRCTKPKCPYEPLCPGWGQDYLEARRCRSQSMKWNECSCSEKHTCNCIFWNLLRGGRDFCTFISEILWSQVFPREILKNLQFLTRWNMEILPLVPCIPTSPLPPLF